MRALPLPLLFGLLLALPAARAEDLPYPPGTSTQEIEGLQTVLVLPSDLSAEKPASFIVVLHGAGGTASGMAGSFAPCAQEGYVVCAPQARDQTWEVEDLKRTLRIAAHLKEVLPIDPKKVHVVGFSNGGWNLHTIAFDDDLHPCTATWIAAGFKGGQVPKWAKTDLAAIAMAGSLDPNCDAARKTVDVLEDKVRHVEFRMQEGLDHKFPRELEGYHHWWLGAMEGRLKPGDDQSFEWTTDLDAAVASQAGQKKGGVLVWLYTQEDGPDGEVARILQHEVFFDAEVRFLGRQIPCVKLDAAEQAARMEAWRVKSVPALVVLDRAGKLDKVYEGKVKASKLARTLRGLVPNRKMP